MDSTTIPYTPVDQVTQVFQSNPEAIDQIAAALSKAQGQLEAASKNRKNEFLGNTFADLESVINVIRKPFAENELCFVQKPGFQGEALTLTTILMHSSGQKIESTMILPYSKGKSELQSIGSAITYGKRYMLMAMVGVPSEDDDGQKATDDLGFQFEKLCQELKLTDEQIAAALAERGATRFEECSVEEGRKILASLRAMKARTKGPGKGAQVQ